MSYSRGVQYEYKSIRFFEQMHNAATCDTYVIRSAGSKGPIDFMAFCGPCQEAVAIQVKSGQAALTTEEANALKGLAEFFGEWRIHIELWTWHARAKGPVVEYY